MAAWIPYAFNALCDLIDKKGNWVSLVMLGGRGPDGEIYYFMCVIFMTWQHFTERLCG